jgi:hypothetical protein
MNMVGIRSISICGEPATTTFFEIVGAKCTKTKGFSNFSFTLSELRHRVSNVVDHDISTFMDTG